MRGVRHPCRDGERSRLARPVWRIVNRDATGARREAALADVQNAIVEWKDAARQLGRDVPSPAALGQWRQRAPRTLHEKLKIIAAREGVSLNAFVTSVLAEAVGKKTT